MTVAHFQRLFDYDAWANGRVLELLQAQPADPAPARHLLAHILAAGEVWLTRLRGRDSSALAIFPDLDLAACAAAHERTSAGYRGYLAAMDAAGLDQAIDYRNTKGDRFSTPVRDILTHVGAHGAYHRGQIARLMRESGVAPVGTDFILYTRLPPA